jgi:membrane associated rhomboid family serine protease
MEELQPPDDATSHEDRPETPLTPIFTYILIGSIAAVFIAQIVFGGAAATLSLTSLVGDDRSAIAAGFVKAYFVRCHEYWRILTGATVHGGLIHVVMNCYAFLMFGRLCEVLSNRAHMAIVFLLACIGGGLLSLYFLPDGISVGASGGIVGLLGYITVYAFRRRRFISKEFRKGLLINLGSLLVFGLVLFNVVDNYGHLGGLVTGAIYGLIQIPSNEYVDPRKARPIAQVFGLIAVAVFVVTCLSSIVLIYNYRNAVLPDSLDAPCTSPSTR